MRKQFLLIALLALLSCAGLVTAHVAVSDTAEQVLLEETAHVGDPSVAELVEVNMTCKETHPHYQWDTALIPGQSPQTTFSTDFSRFAGRTDSTPFVSIGFSSPFNQGRTSKSPMDLVSDSDDALLPLYQTVADRTKPGTIHTEVLDAKDFFDFYPVDFVLDTPGYHYDASHLEFLLENHPNDTEADGYRSELQFLRSIEEAFRFPVPEELKLTIQISKGPDGNVYETNCIEGEPDLPPADRPYDITAASHSAPASGDQGIRIHVWTYSCQKGKNLYFIPEFRTSDGALLDYSLTPGYGIYHLDLSREPLHIDDLELVLPLSPEQNPVDLYLDDSETHFLLPIQENQEETLYLLDSASGAVSQKIPVGPVAPDGERWTYYLSDGDLLLFVDSDQSFRFFLLDESGQYQEQFSCSLPTSDELPVSWGFHTALAFDGERLAAVSNSDRSYEAPSCGLSLLIWDRTGLLYAGNYCSSLDRTITKDGYQAVFPHREDPLSIRFLSEEGA